MCREAEEGGGCCLAGIGLRLSVFTTDLGYIAPRPHKISSN